MNLCYFKLKVSKLFCQLTTKLQKKRFKVFPNCDGKMQGSAKDR